jgi:Signal peptidase, peptidase S26
MNNDKPSLPEGTASVPPGGAVPPGAVSAEPMNVPPIPLDRQGEAKTGSSTTTPPKKKDTEPKDSFRELIETVVFVVVLVLMLKTFLAEAFVIPTGSMADTLLGYHYKVVCKQCGKENLVNASKEAEAPPPPPGQEGERIINCTCQNCGFVNELRQVAPDKRGQP